MGTTITINERNLARVEVETEYGTLTINQRDYPRRGGYRQWNSKPRAYVWGDTQESIIENLANRMRRPSRLYRQGLKRVVKDTGLNLNLDGMVWSQYAGCSCPCSPGFVLPRQNLLIDEVLITRFDINCSLKDVAIIDEGKPARFEVVA